MLHDRTSDVKFSVHGTEFAIPSLNVQKLSPADKYLIGDSEPMRILKRSIEQVSASRSTTLITGESGTGKELVARAIHYLSSRSNGPFQAINCGALPETLLEDELFGHIKGSFTGAISNKKGLFAQAQQGSIFLDELGEMPQAMQVKLLRVLQERKVRPLGSTDSAEIELDVRVIAATNKNLRQEIEKGQFREDLFFRLNVFEIQLPPLRERILDIPLLASHILTKVAAYAELNAPARISGDALRALGEYEWPGNVRELENVLERLSVIVGAGKAITAEHVYATTAPPTERFSPNRSGTRSVNGDGSGPSVKREFDLYEDVLKSANGNYSEAARRLQLKRTTFCQRLEKLRKLISYDRTERSDNSV